MKAYAPHVLTAIADCLRLSYWYKDDLKSFLLRVEVPPEALRNLPWEDNKRSIIRQLLDTVPGQPRGKELLDQIVGGLVEQDESFPHLRKLEDGNRKAADATASVRCLKEMLGAHTVAQRADEARRLKRTENERAAAEVRKRNEELAELNREFLLLCEEQDPNRRGLTLEPLLRRLFSLHDLEPHGSYANPGEQIDGSIVVDGRHLLVEARWLAVPADPKQIRDFQGKVRSKLDATLGLMISMTGFTNNAIVEAEKDLVIVLMEGRELATVFQGVTDLAQLLSRKLRRAADRGEALYRIGM